MGCPLPSSQPLQLSPVVHLRGLRMGKNRIRAPESGGVYQRNDFSEPRLLHLPIQRKVLDLRRLVFFSSHLLMFRLPGLCCRNTCVSWLLPDLFGAVPPSCLRRCPPALKSSATLLNTTKFSTFRLCFFFFSYQQHSVIK